MAAACATFRVSRRFCLLEVSAGLLCLLVCLPREGVNGLLASTQHNKGVVIPVVVPPSFRLLSRTTVGPVTAAAITALFLQPTTKSNSLEASSSSSSSARGGGIIENVSSSHHNKQQQQPQALYSTLSQHHDSLPAPYTTTVNGNPISSLLDEARQRGDDFIEAIRQHILTYQDDWYDRAIHMRCPFMRRRATDAVETFHEIVRVVLDPQEQWLGPNPSLVCHGKTCTKQFGVTVDEVMAAIRKDWRDDGALDAATDHADYAADHHHASDPSTTTKHLHHNKGYYVTGRLSTDIYRDDCFFDGPDPDMPVTGLRKYMNAASQLFDQKQSWSKLLSLEQQQKKKSGSDDGDDDEVIIVAHWQFSGILRLPWKPILPLVNGSTTYHLDATTGLVVRHLETWDMSATEAFLRTFFPIFFPPR
jgi:hypothetical protein